MFPPCREDRRRASSTGYTRWWIGGGGRQHPLILLILALTTALLLPGTEGLTAFDCAHRNTTYQVIDLMSPADCPDPEKDYETPRQQRLQILQTDGQMPVHSSRCQVTISKEVTRCGFTSLVYGSKWTVWQKDYQLTPRECRQASTTGKLVVEGREFKAKRDVKTTYLFYSQGGLDDAGNCHTVSNFKSGGRWFQKSYELTTLVIELNTIRGTVDQGSGEVLFANGLRAVYKDQVLRDAIEGTMVWVAVEPKCKTTVSELFNGLATLHRQRGAETLRGSIVLVQKNDTSQFAGLVLREVITTCKVRCFSTQIRGLVVCPYREGDEPLPKHSFKAHFQQEHVDLQTQLGYLHTSTNMAMADRFAIVQADLCQVDRRTLFNKLQAISGAHNPHALIDLYGPGYQVYQAGAAVYLAKCVPVEVTRRDYANCTQEMPVREGNRTVFLDPFTRILTDFPTIIPCSDLMPARWKIAGNWYCAHPAVLPCQRPRQLNSSTTRFLPVTEFTLGMGQGVYSPAQQRQHQEFQRAQVSRRPVVAKLTNAATANSHGGHLGLSISAAEMPTLSFNMAYHLFPVIYYLGEAWVYLSTALWIALLIKLIIGALARSFVAYRRYGCGRWVVFALWETLFVIVTTPWRLVTQTAAAMTAPLEKNGLYPLDIEEPEHQQLQGNPDFQALQQQLADLQEELRQQFPQPAAGGDGDGHGNHPHPNPPGGHNPGLIIFPHQH